MANALLASRTWASAAVASAVAISRSDTKSVVSTALRHSYSWSASWLSSPRADWGTGCGDAEVPTTSAGKHGARCAMEIALYNREASRPLEYDEMQDPYLPVLPSHHVTKPWALLLLRH